LALDLPSAKATLLAETLLEQEPYIERSGYITAADALPVLAVDPDSDRYWLWEGDTRVDRYLAEEGGPLMMIELSQSGMDTRGLERPRDAPAAATAQARLASGAGWPCVPVPAGIRYTITAFADPRTGWFLGHTFQPMPADLWQRVTPELPHTPAPPSPPPTSSPDARRSPQPPSLPSHAPAVDPSVLSSPLGRGEYPAAVANTIGAWPLVRGASWTYRAKGHTSGRGWHTGTVREVVEVANRLGPDLMEVWVSTTGDIWAYGSGWRVITPSTVIDGGSPSQHSGFTREELLATAANRAQARSDEPITLARLPLQVGDRYNYWWDLSSADDVDTPAGHFEGCSVLREIFNAGNSWGHWLCPGVGIAYHEQPGCGSVYGYYTVLELVDYSIPPLIAVQ
jgi:hypothetical protein